MIGAVLAGAVQDFIVLVASMRRNGRSLPEIARDELGLVTGTATAVAVLIIVIVALAGLGFAVVNALYLNAWGTFTIAMTIPIGLFMGFYLQRFRPGQVAEVSLLGGVLLIAVVIFGRVVAQSSIAGWFELERTTLVWGHANEVREAWKVALSRHNGPTAVALTRQNVPTFEPSNLPTVEKGAYVLKDFGTPEVILMASGSELSLIMDAAQKLHEEGRDVRVVSFPSWALFEKQDDAYKESVLPKNLTARLAVEAGASLGWERYARSVLGIDHYGASAPYKVIFEKFGFTVENVVAKAKALLA